MLAVPLGKSPWQRIPLAVAEAADVASDDGDAEDLFLSSRGVYLWQKDGKMSGRLGGSNNREWADVLIVGSSPPRRRRNPASQFANKQTRRRDT